MRTRALLRRMRWDMAVCFILTMLCIVGISELDNKIGFFKKGFDAMEEAVSSDQSTSIPDGEIGGNRNSCSHFSDGFAGWTDPAFPHDRMQAGDFSTDL